MATTLKDIARECSLAVSTVSNILNNNGTSFASAEVKARVHATAARLGYRKNYLSTSLRTRTTQSVGLIVDSVGDRTRQDFLAPFVEQFSVAGLEVALSEHRFEVERAEAALEGFAHRCKDAVVVFTDLLGRSASDIDRWGQALRRYPGKLLGIGSQQRGVVASLDIDRSAAINRSVEHLLSGHERVVVAYRHEWDLRPQFDYWQHPAVELWGGVFTAAHWLARFDALPPGELPGFFVRTDEVAIPVLGELLRRGVRVPEQLELISFDNFAFSEHTSPPLSTWDIGFQRLGVRSQTLVADWLRGKPLPNDYYETFLPEWVERKSHRGSL